MSNLAIIPARGGSKRIPRKNIREFFGKPVIAYPIQTAIQSKLFDEVMVSTDDPEIEKISKKFGAAVPFLRSSHNANDQATLADVIAEVLGSYQKKGRSFHFFCCILPTTPFLLPEHLSQGYDHLISGNYDSVFPATRFSHPIQRAFKIKDGKASMLWPDMIQTRTQDLPATYYDSGQFYWMTVHSFQREHKLFTKNTGAIEFPENYFVDIDNETDWKKAELLYSVKSQIQK